MIQTTPILYKAVEANNTEIAEFLKASANIKGIAKLPKDLKKTALFKAIENDNPQIVEILLQGGASVNYFIQIAEFKSYSPLFLRT